MEALAASSVSPVSSGQEEFYLQTSFAQSAHNSLSPPQRTRRVFEGGPCCVQEQKMLNYLYKWQGRNTLSLFGSRMYSATPLSRRLTFSFCVVYPDFKNDFAVAVVGEGGGEKGRGGRRKEWMSSRRSQPDIFQTPNQDPQPERIWCEYIWPSGRQRFWLKYWHCNGFRAHGNRILEIRAVRRHPESMITVVGPGKLIMNFKLATKWKIRSKYHATAAVGRGPPRARLAIERGVLCKNHSQPPASITRHYYLLTNCN